jgi:surface antigen
LAGNIWVERDLNAKAMRILSLTLAVAVTGIVSGCSTTGGAVPSLAFGEISGGAQDSDNKLAGAALVNALHGGILPAEVTSQMNTATQDAALQAEYQALEYTPAGEKVTWGETGAPLKGEVVASQPYRVGSQNCRQYTHTVFTGGAPVANRGTACRNPDGSWTPLT